MLAELCVNTRYDTIPGRIKVYFKLCPDSHNLDLVELRDLEFLRGAAEQDRKLVQGELVLVIARTDAVHWNHA